MGSRPDGPELDGNALAGPLSELFTTEMTTAVGRCRGCGNHSAVAEWMVYGPEPGLVARCPGCQGILMRLVRSASVTWLDLSGVSTLRLPASAT
ncbi:MAG TPA: DUF6510 family protein [Actinomycetes bacterium]|nr:DUF6510 family protein [Actinomycetes bacterium]